MPHVLLSNDDGVHAPGLRALADAFLASGWRVTVVAPDGERSAAAHSITIKQPLVATRTSWKDVPKGASLLSVWATSGTPADCVKVALHELCDEKPDIVVSGVNAGWNVGTDVYYSGTVGAAREAAFEDYPAMAVSVGAPRGDRYRRAAELAALYAGRVLSHPLPPDTVLNLNLPSCDPAEICGVVEAPLARIRYTDSYDKMARSAGRSAYWLKGEIIREACTPDSDLAMVAAGYATLTVLSWDTSMRAQCGNILQDSK